MKNLIAFLIVLLPLCTIAQKTHTVAAKESLYSISRMYNIHPRELAAFNNISINDGLNIGQVIRIPGKTSMEPLSDNAPATQTQPAAKPAEVSRPAASKGTIPVFHTVEAKEGLYSISKKYNATIAQVRQWNNLQTDNISIGDQLIVGYSAGTKEPVRQTETAKNDPPKQTAQPVQQPAIPKESTTSQVQKPSDQEQKKQAENVVKNQSINSEAADFGGGYFKPFYDKQIATTTMHQDSGTAGVFKTTSGWEDGKYYCLHNSAPAGSYVKITNPANNRSVYAKVLDLMPDLKQNNTLVIRISNAAAAVLGVEGAEFNCILTY